MVIPPQRCKNSVAKEGGVVHTQPAKLLGLGVFVISRRVVPVKSPDWLGCRHSMPVRLAGSGSLPSCDPAGNRYRASDLPGHCKHHLL